MMMIIIGVGDVFGIFCFLIYLGFIWDNNIYCFFDVIYMFDYNINFINNLFYVVDCFWILDNNFYVSKFLVILFFIYCDVEWMVIGNSIVEVNLGVQCFYLGLNVWGDYFLQGSIDVINNVIFGVFVFVGDFYCLWILSEMINLLVVELVYFQVFCENGILVLMWEMENE